MRIAFIAMVWQSVPSFYYPATLSHPSGLARFLDLTFLVNPEILGTLRGLLAVALVFYAAGFLMFVSLTFMTFLLSACGSFENSQGAINHTLQPLALVALAQWGVAGYSLVRNRVVDKRALFPMATAERTAASCMQRKLLWFRATSPPRSPSWSAAKANGSRDAKPGRGYCEDQHESYLNIQEPVDHLAKAVPQFIIDHPNVTRVFFGLGFALELFSFLALLGRWPAVLIGVSLILMHDMIARVMDLHFAIFERLALIFLVNVPWLAALAIAAIWNLSARSSEDVPVNATSRRAFHRPHFGQRKLV